MKKKLICLISACMICMMTACGSGESYTESKTAEAESAFSEAGSASSVSDPEEASGTDSEVPVLDRLLGTEGKVCNIYASDRKLLELLERFDSSYETASVSANGTISGNGTVSGNDSVSENETSAQDSEEEIEEGKIGDVTIRWHIIENDRDRFETVLDKALVNQSGSADDQVDLFIVDGGSVSKYCDSSVNVAKPLSRLGLNEADLGQQYSFTKTIGSDEKDVQRAITWEVPCGLFVYRRSAARAVLGTDDPAEVEEKVKDWDSFQSTASLAATKGYKMLSGYTDAYYVYLARRKNGWVDDEEQLSVDSQMASWVHTTKTFTENGYNNRRSGFHSDGWKQDVEENSRLFGTFLTASDISEYLISEEDFPETVSSNTAGTAAAPSVSANGTGGDWAVCTGPSSFSQGGRWLCVNQNTDNASLARDLIRRVFCSENSMNRITKESGEMTNHMSAMKKIGETEGFGSSLFGSENYVSVYDQAARNCDAGKRTFYDREINEAFMNAFIPYFDGTADEGSALNQFYTEVMNQYPDLSY